MLQKTNEEPKLKLVGFLVGLELQDGLVDIEYIENALAGACQWIEGVGKIDVECLGEIEIVNEDEIDLIEGMKES